MSKKPKSNRVSECMRVHYKKRIDQAVESGNVDEMLNILMETRNFEDESLTELNASIKTLLGQMLLREKNEDEGVDAAQEESESVGGDYNSFVEHPVPMVLDQESSATAPDSAVSAASPPLNPPVPSINVTNSPHFVDSAPIAVDQVPVGLLAEQPSTGWVESGAGADGEGEGGEGEEVTYVMEILAAVVGWVIGRSGSRIKEIQAQSGCSMWIDQDVPNNQARKLFIRGTKETVAVGASLVSELIETAPVLAAGKAQEAVRRQHSGSDAEAGTFDSIVIDCPADRVGLLIGRKGWVIKKIMQDSGAQVSINQSVRDGADRKVIISGAVAAVQVAEKHIRGILDPDAGAEQAGDFDPMRFSQGYGHSYGHGNGYSSAGAPRAHPRQPGGSGDPTRGYLPLALGTSAVYSHARERLTTPTAGTPGGRNSGGEYAARGRGYGPGAGAGAGEVSSRGHFAPSKSNSFAAPLKLKAETVNNYPNAKSVLTAAYANSNAQLIRKNNQMTEAAMGPGTGAVRMGAGPDAGAGVGVGPVQVQPTGTAVESQVQSGAPLMPTPTAPPAQPQMQVPPQAPAPSTLSVHDLFTHLNVKASKPNAPVFYPQTQGQGQGQSLAQAHAAPPGLMSGSGAAQTQTQTDMSMQDPLLVADYLRGAGAVSGAGSGGAGGMLGQHLQHQHQYQPAHLQDAYQQQQSSLLSGLAGGLNEGLGASLGLRSGLQQDPDQGHTSLNGLGLGDTMGSAASHAGSASAGTDGFGYAFGSDSNLRSTLGSGEQPMFVPGFGLQTSSQWYTQGQGQGHAEGLGQGLRQGQNSLYGDLGPGGPGVGNSASGSRFDRNQMY